MRKLAIGLSIALALLIIASPIAAAKVNPFSNWQIYYFKSTTGSCSGGAYTPTFKDGGGFATNQPNNNNQEPIVNDASVDVQIVVTGSTANAVVWYEVDSIFGPINIGTLDGSGNGTFCFTVTLPANNGACTTSPEKIALNSNTQGAFDGNIIDHFLLGTTCGTTTGTAAIVTTVVDEGPGTFVTMTPVPTAYVGDSFHDTATLTVSGDSAANPTGTVHYYFYTAADDCTGDYVASDGAVGGTAASPTVGNSASTGPLGIGVYSFKAVYTGDSHYVGSSSDCEPFHIVQNPNTVPEFPLGSAVMFAVLVPALLLLRKKIVPLG
jgi:hypothetical protein